MKEKTLLKLTIELGYQLAISGADTYRIEESITRIFAAYGYEAQAFMIPNCLIVSMVCSDGSPMTQMKRIGSHGNNMDAVERYSNLSRKICCQIPEPETGLKWIQETGGQCLVYNLKWKIAGYFVGAFGFCLFYGGGFTDALGAGLGGLLILLIDLWMSRLQASQLFRTILAAFSSSFLCYGFYFGNLIANADAAIIGSLMLLVPGLLFTNAMRDIMYGDTNSGLNRIVQVVLIAITIALGTAGALSLAHILWGTPVITDLTPYHPIIQNFVCFIGVTGFGIYFNVHGSGSLLCSAGAVLSWTVYLITVHHTDNVLWANLAGSAAASLYAECLARVRKYPAVSYLVVSIFPLLPGAALYYTMNSAVQGNMNSFLNQGIMTVAIAGAIALGILLISGAFRLTQHTKNSMRHK